MKKMKEMLTQFWIISDCTDPNAQSRYKAAFRREFPGACVDCVPIKYPLEGAGCAIDLINELRGTHSAVFVNSARRRDRDKEEGHKNGRPFLYFYVGTVLVIASDEAIIFGMFARAGIDFKEVRAIDFEKFDVPQDTQFRSLKCVPTAARSIVAGEYEGESYAVKVDDPGDCIWYVDNFGNCKTTKVDFIPNSSWKQYERLSDVPDDTPGQIKGSSEYGKDFLEIVWKDGDAAEKLKLQVGQKV